MRREGKMTVGKLIVPQEQLSLNLIGQEGSSKKWSESSFLSRFVLVSFVGIETRGACDRNVEHFCCVVRLSMLL